MSSKQQFGLFPRPVFVVDTLGEVCHACGRYERTVSFDAPGRGWIHLCEGCLARGIEALAEANTRARAAQKRESGFDR